MQRQPDLTLIKLDCIAARARREPTCQIFNLMYLLSEDFLAGCFRELRKSAAPGVDGETWEMYSSSLSENLSCMIDWIKRGQYWPQPVRRVNIPKDEHSKRPLGIPTIGDKIIQLAMTKILTSIFDGDFLPVSYGYRPGKGAHQALRNLESCLFTSPITTVIDADIKGFFDNVSHEKLMVCLQQRIGDKKFLRLINRFLKAGVMEDGVYSDTEIGTPQGGILSPILSNIFLHYVLDMWLAVKAKTEYTGKIALFRYADDFVICVEKPEEAEKLLEAIRKRFAICGLTLAEEKTRLLSFGRKAWFKWRGGGKKPETFDFLGFTHYVGLSRSGRYKVGRVTSRKKFSKSLSAIKVWLASVRNTPMRSWWGKLAVKLRGYFQYYGVSGNSTAISRYANKVRELIHQALARRSQRKAGLWGKLNRYLVCYPLPKPIIYHKWYDIKSA